MSRKSFNHSQLYMAIRVGLHNTFRWMPVGSGIGAWFPPRVREEVRIFEDGSTLTYFVPA